MKKDLIKKASEWFMLILLGSLVTGFSSYYDKAKKVINYPDSGIKKDSLLHIEICSKLDTSTYYMREYIRIEGNKEIYARISNIENKQDLIIDELRENNGYLRAISETFKQTSFLYIPLPADTVKPAKEMIVLK